MKYNIYLLHKLNKWHIVMITRLLTSLDLMHAIIRAQGAMISQSRLMNLMFLCDRELLKTRGYSITDSQAYSVSSFGMSLPFLMTAEHKKVVLKFFSVAEYIDPVLVIKTPRDEELLSPVQHAVIKDVVNRHKSLNDVELIDLCLSLPEASRISLKDAFSTESISIITVLVALNYNSEQCINILEHINFHDYMDETFKEDRELLSFC
jgi:hypothetical protein